MNLPPLESITTIRLILEDQLNHQHSWYDETREGTLYVVAELYEHSQITNWSFNL